MRTVPVDIKQESQKQETGIGDACDQNFVQISYAKLLSILRNTAAKYGIPVVDRVESYTSKASLPDLDRAPMYREKDAHKATFSGKRKKRGLYVSSNGAEINSDVNAAGNIMRKEYPYAFDDFDLNRLRVTVERVGFADLYPQHKSTDPVSGRRYRNHKSPVSFKRREKRKQTKRMYEKLFPPVRKKEKAA